MLRLAPASAPVGALLAALAVGLCCNFDPGFACMAQNVSDDKTQLGLHITVLQGEDGVNILKSKMAVKPVVEVRDKNNLPVAGVAVVFIAPESGPRVAFANGGNTFMTTTDANGRAVVATTKPVGRGSFKIRVKADFHGQAVTTSIVQTNYVTVAAATAAGATVGAGAGAAAGGLSTTMIALIVVGVAAAIGVGVVVAKSGGSKPTGTVGAGGTPTITAP